MKHHQLTHTQGEKKNPVNLAEDQLFEVSGGMRARLSNSAPLVREVPKEPIYITLAIGEGGGRLPDILS